MFSLLRRLLPHKDIGWKEIGETFTRFTVLATRFGTLYLHRFDAPNWHPHCHDHPWDFLAVILSGGYYEATSSATAWRGPGSVLRRRAEFAHNVLTRGVCWSLVWVGPKRRAWGLVECGRR
jgi:hypothetical protein